MTIPPQSDAPQSQRPLAQKIEFLVLWVLANVVPWLSLWVFYRFLPVGSLLWFVAATLVGLAQWLVLRLFLSNIGGWAIATLLGATIGFAGFAAFLLSMWVVPILTGIAVGVGQWQVLRRKLTGAKWWIVANLLGAIVGLAVYFIVPIYPGSFSSNSGQLEHTIFAMGIVIESVSSVITGLTMLWLLDRNANRRVVLQPELPLDPASVMPESLD